MNTAHPGSASVDLGNVMPSQNCILVGDLSASALASAGEDFGTQSGLHIDREERKRTRRAYLRLDPLFRLPKELFHKDKFRNAYVSMCSAR